MVVLIVVSGKRGSSGFVRRKAGGWGDHRLRKEASYSELNRPALTDHARVMDVKRMMNMGASPER